MRHTPLILLAAVACNIEPRVDTPGEAPQAAIVEPSPGASVPEGPATLIGRASDPQDPPERLIAQWSAGASEEGPWRDLCGNFVEADGTTRCAGPLEPDDVLLRLIITDVAGFQDVVVQDIQVRPVAPPVVDVTSPSATRIYFEHLPIPLEAVVSDADHMLADLSLAWRSSLVGALDIDVRPDVGGLVRTQTLLPVGEHMVELIVTDPDGTEGRDGARITVLEEDDGPTCRIAEPDTGEVVVEPGTDVAVRGVVLDDRTPPEGLDVAWLVDGALREEAEASELGSVTLDYDAGTQTGTSTLTLSVDDGTGHTCEVDLDVVVDTPPLVVVLAPEDDASLALGAPVQITARVADARTTDASLILVSATSDVDGPLFSVRANTDGTRSVATTLSAGPHTLTISGTDGDGLTTSVTRSVVVE